MNQILVQEKCLEHSEDIVAVNENEKDFEKRGLCTKCLANISRKEVKHIQVSINQIKQTKQLLKVYKTNLLQSNLENINNLSESVELLKNFYIQQIELIIVSIKKWNQQIKNLEEDFINKVQSKESNDYQLFIQYIQEEQKNQIQDQIDFKVNIQNHKKQITLFDLCKERTSQKRIGCLRCSDGTIKYTSIYSAHQMWKQIQQKKIEKMNQNADVFQNKVNCLKDYLQIIQKGYISALQNTTNKLNIIYQDYSNKVNSTTNNLINTSWKSLSKEEIIKIAQDQVKLINKIVKKIHYQLNIIIKIIKSIKLLKILFYVYKNVKQLNLIKQIDQLIIYQQTIIFKVKLKKALMMQNVKVIQTLLINHQKNQFYQIQKKKSQIYKCILRNVNNQVFIHNNILQQSNLNLKKNNQNQQFIIYYRIIKLSKLKGVMQLQLIKIIQFKQIKVFEFKQEQLKQSQILNEHTNDINTLNFMKKSNQFISGSDDNSIIIWQMNENNEWICKQKLNEHTNSIYCLVLNNNEDIIISGSRDKSIKVWMKQNKWICLQTIIDHTDFVYQLSMNDSQNKVISCGKDNLILIIEQSQLDQKWNIIQKINVQQFGRRICFINDNQFAFQPNSKEQMHIYEMNSNNQQYSKTKDIIVKSGSDCDCLFPQQYIKQKYLVVNKNGYNVNLIRKYQNGEIINEQSIDFGTHILYGLMSDNGDYLITCDDKQKEIQIRKYQEK
ncbi:unnamed protein product [Paramecium sonneborni]|uniref:WD40-repeat-containing domain n=1 Tax=Paramecium sonneborni TaxID=65129 RepID=A0A8S1RQV3_9CILI|nr:unnamed protein product [Paramecium sonneborni]